MGKTVCKTSKGANAGVYGCEKGKKIPGFVIYLNFKDNTFTAIKRHATPGKLGM